MNKYLLLRDNKQSGPYSAEELSVKGLKAYDLVWLEGKSAAWRYPSEMEELKPFAPVVEEQPYDRFYKKPAQQTATDSQEVTAHTTTTNKQAVTAQQPIQPVIPPVSTTTTIPVTLNTGSKKVYVTLPAATTRPAAVTASAAKKEEVVQPVVEQKPVTKLPVITAETPATPHFSTLVNNTWQQQESEIIPGPHPQHHQKKDPYKLLMRTLVAACFLLGGVVIGIAITYNSQRSDRQATLDKLVTRLQEKSTANTSSPSATPTQQEPVNTSPGTNTTNAETPAHQEILSVADKKEKTGRVDNKTISLPNTKEVVNEPAIKIVPAVVTNQPEEKSSREPDAQATRENIRQLVQVEASSFKTGVLGGISELHFTLSNNSPYPLDQVEVEIKYLGPEKRVVKVQRLLFNDLGAGGQKTLEAPRTNRGVSIDYVITKINSKALGIAHAGF